MFFFETAGDDLIDSFVPSVVIDQVEHVDAHPSLTKAFDAAKPLLKARRIPRQVDVDQRAQCLQV